MLQSSFLLQKYRTFQEMERLLTKGIEFHQNQIGSSSFFSHTARINQLKEVRIRIRLLIELIKENLDKNLDFSPKV